jgi:hypothetical protein
MEQAQTEENACNYSLSHVGGAAASHELSET